LESENRKTITLADYEPLIGVEAVERITEKARPLHDFHVANVNATYYGGGGAYLLQSLTLLMNSTGIKTGGGLFGDRRISLASPRRYTTLFKGIQ
jgi:hypothetical protein